MNRLRLQALLDRHGPHLEDWPWWRRPSVRRLLARDPGARRLYDRALAAEQRLRQVSGTDVAEPLRARLYAIPERHPQASRRDRIRPVRTGLWAGGALAGATACLVAGLALGTTLLAPTTDNLDVAGLAYGDTYLTETLP